MSEQRWERPRQEMREMRERFGPQTKKDKLEGALRPGDTAALKRCATVAEVTLEGAFWTLAREPYYALRQAREGEDDDRLVKALAVLTLCFSSAAQGEQDKTFGRWLHRALAEKGSPEDGAAMRFRKLVAARTPDELARQLRSLLRLAGGRPDWGALGADVMQWCRGDEARERVCRRWAQDFYGGRDEEQSAEGAKETA